MPVDGALKSPTIGISYEMEYSLFRPSKIAMLREYPELRTFDEFKELSNDDLNFVWWIANATSELSNITDLKERRKQAYIKVWGKENTDQILYLEGRYSEKVRAAIERMKNFNPSVRMRAKMMLYKTMNDFEGIINVDITTITDPDELKKHTDVRTKVLGALPDIIRQLEQGFGISEEAEEKDDKTRQATYWDKVMDYSEQNAG